jgi:hypothetical protein
VEETDGSDVEIPLRQEVVVLGNTRQLRISTAMNKHAPAL